MPSDNDLRHAQASRRFVRAGELDRIYISTWQEMGLIALEAEKNGDPELLGYTSMGSWMKSAFPRSRSVVYAAWGAVKELQDIPAEQLAEIAHSTAHVLKKVSKSVRNRKDVIDAAKVLTTEEFAAKMKHDYPNEHIEAINKRMFRFEESQEKVLEQAFDLVKLFHPEISRDEDCLEVLASEYLLANQSAFEELRNGKA